MQLQRDQGCCKAPPRLTHHSKIKALVGPPQGSKPQGIRPSARCTAFQEKWISTITQLLSSVSTSKKTLSNTNLGPAFAKLKTENKYKTLTKQTITTGLV